MSVGEAIIPCAICGHTTPADGVCVGCKPTPQAVCIGCAYRGPRPGVQVSDDDVLGVDTSSPNLWKFATSPITTFGHTLSTGGSVYATVERDRGTLSLVRKGASAKEIEAALRTMMAALEAEDGGR